MPRHQPFAAFPRRGDPSKPSLAPQTAEPLAPYSSNAAPDRPAGRAGTSREPRRSTLDPDRGYYGEAPVRLWRDERAVGDATPPKAAKNQKLQLNCFNRRYLQRNAMRTGCNRRWLRDPHRVLAGVSPGLRGPYAGLPKRENLFPNRADSSKLRPLMTPDQRPL